MILGKNSRGAQSTVGGCDRIRGALTYDGNIEIMVVATRHGFDSDILTAYNAAMQATYSPHDSNDSTHFNVSATPEQPEWRDILRRVSVVSWAVLAAMVAALFLRLPTVVLPLSALGSPITINISGTVLMSLFIAALAGSGAESVVRLHPRFQQGLNQDRRRFLPYWALPAALSVLSVLLMPLAPTRIAQVAVLALGGLAVTVSLFGLYATVDQGTQGFRRSRLMLNVLAYGAALALFLLVYQTRTRSLLSGTLVAATAALLAAELLRAATPRVELVLSYAAIVGLILGEVTWALNYWLVPGLTGGLFLLLIFYLMVGLAQQGLQDQLNRRVLLEFGIFGVLALILIAVVGPGF
jgi:hypothetical protein